MVKHANTPQCLNTYVALGKTIGRQDFVETEYIQGSKKKNKNKNLTYGTSLSSFFGNTVADPRVEASALLSVAGIPDCQSSPDHQVMDPAPRTSSAFIQQWFNIKYKICFREIDLDHALLCPSPSRPAAGPERQSCLATPSHPAAACSESSSSSSQAGQCSSHHVLRQPTRMSELEQFFLLKCNASHLYWS